MEKIGLCSICQKKDNKCEDVIIGYDKDGNVIGCKEFSERVPDIDLLKEVIKSWKSRELSEFSALYLIANELFPSQIKKEDIEWGKQKLKEIRENKSLN